MGGVAEPSGEGWVCGEDVAVEAFDFDERVPFIGEQLLIAEDGGAGLEIAGEVVAGAAVESLDDEERRHGGGFRTEERRRHSRTRSRQRKASASRPRRHA